MRLTFKMKGSGRFYHDILVVFSLTTFEESLNSFKKNLATKSTKGAWIHSLNATRLQDVVDEVTKAKAQYDNGRRDSKLYKRITSFSKRIAYYGQVLDVMVQHHPEYVSLVWGTMKLIFSGIIEHERLGVTIVTALDDIGEALSRVDLAESLYPTEKMKNVIISLNCHVMTFLCRALDWYRSGSLSRTMQSITRPAALRYDDLIRDINKTLSQVNDLSQAGSQAEQRDMHEEMRQEYHAHKDFRSVVQHRLDEMGYQLNSLVQHKYIDGEFKLVHQQLQEVKALVKTISEKQISSEQTLLQALLLTKQDIQATQVDIRNQISEVQLNQALSFILAKCAINHQATYESAFGKRRARRAIAAKCAPFWNSQQFQKWDQLNTHNVIVLALSQRDRLSVRDFYIGIIEQLITSHVPAFWIIEQRYDAHQKEHKHGIFEVLRSLVAQTLKAALLKTDVALSSQIRAFEAARTIEEYTSILVRNLSQFKLAYLFLDANAILPEYAEECHCVLRKIPDLVREQNALTVLKIMILSPGLSRSTPLGDGRQSTVVKIGQTSKGKSRKVPQAPLRGKKTRFASLR